MTKSNKPKLFVDQWHYYGAIIHDPKITEKDLKRKGLVQSVEIPREYPTIKFTEIFRGRYSFIQNLIKVSTLSCKDPVLAFSLVKVHGKNNAPLKIDVCSNGALSQPVLSLYLAPVYLGEAKPVKIFKAKRSSRILKR